MIKMVALYVLVTYIGWITSQTTSIKTDPSQWSGLESNSSISSINKQNGSVTNKY